MPLSFSIPCESWGSATSSTCVMPNCDAFFQYSLRIVGFRDDPAQDLCDQQCQSFSIPCESWGSATLYDPDRDEFTVLSVFPANRGVPRLISCRLKASTVLPFQYSLRIVGFRDVLRFSMQWGILPFSIPCESWGSATLFWHQDLQKRELSVFPANRGVPRQSPGKRFIASRTTFSIPCESWGSAT